MFCEKCGKANPVDAVFCEGCGARVSAPPPPPKPQQQVVQPVAPKPRKTAAEKKAEAADKAAKLKEKVKNLPKKVWVLSGAGLVVLLAFFIFLGIGSSMTSPTTVAKRYFAAMYVDRNVGKAFNDLYIEPSEFVNKETLASYFEDDLKDAKAVVRFVAEKPQKPRKPGLIARITARIEGYDPSDLYGKKDELTTSITVRYTTTDGNEHSERIQMFDTGKRSLLLWKKYAVAMDMDRLIAKDVKIAVFKGSTVTVDGITLKNPKAYDAADSSSYYEYSSSSAAATKAVALEVYTISSIFDTRHEIVIQHPTFEDYTDSDSFSSGRTVEYLDMEFKQATYDTLLEQTKTTLKNFLMGALEKKPFDSYGLKLSVDGDEVKKTKDRYAELISNRAGWTSVKVNTIEEYNSDRDMGGDTLFRFGVRCDIEYTDEWGERNGNWYAEITWAYENGEWVIYEPVFR